MRAPFERSMEKPLNSTNEELIQRYREDPSNIELRNEIVMKNEGLIHFVIKRNNLFVEGVHDYEELVQEGFLKLIEAVERFDPERGVMFSSYACQYILSMTRGRAEYNKELSLDAPVKNSEDELKLEDTIQDDRIEIENNCIDHVFNLGIRTQVRNNLDPLPGKVLVMYYRRRLTETEISIRLGITKAEVASIRRKALNSLRGSGYFKRLYSELFQPISYVKAIDYSNEKVTANRISDPTVEKALRCIGIENNAIRKTLKKYIE